MTLAELIAEVYTITNRPDRVAETLTAVRSATLKLHQSDFYYKDLFETGISFTTAEYIQDFEYRTFIPRFRQLKWLRDWDPIGEVAGKFYTVIAPENALDDYNLAREDICYVAGPNLHIRSKAQFQYALLSCYIHPDITELGYDSWIALDHPYAIVYEAASSLLRMIGKPDESNAIKIMANEQLAEIRISGIENTGR
jgi:hypothetical protein